MRRRANWTLTVTSLAIAALMLAACGAQDASDGDGGQATQPAGEDSPDETAAAGSGEFVVANWGGETGAARDAIAHPRFEELTGLEAVDVGGSVDYGKIRVMVDAGRPEWDVAITALSAYFTLGEEYFEPIDYARNEELWENVINTHEYGAPDHIGCEAIVYRTEEFDEGQAPSSWEDFWDTENFPGRRALGADGGVPWFTLENAIMATGASPSEVYPIDMDLAFEKMSELRSTGQLEIWDSYAEGAQMLATGQVSIARMHIPTIWDLVIDGTVTVNWPEAICWTEMVHIIKGADMEAAMDYVEVIADPEIQAEMVQQSHAGPVNRDALELVPEDIRDLLPVPEQYLEQVVWQDYEWYGANYEDMAERWNTWQLEG